MVKFDQRSLVIGDGQIGRAIYEVLKPKKAIFIRDLEEVDYPDIDVLHVTFPYSESFVHDVGNYIEQYNPTTTIVYSTVPIGTCAKIGNHVAHSPVEGKHPELKESIQLGVRWVGCEDKITQLQVVDYWTPFVRTVRVMNDAKFTEFLKLRSTAKYGINLAWTDYEYKISEDLGMDFVALQQFDADYNQLYEDLEMPEYKRYILSPPGGTIGGHCVVPNAELLDKQYPSPMLKIIKKMKKRGK